MKRSLLTAVLAVVLAFCMCTTHGLERRYTHEELMAYALSGQGKAKAEAIGAVLESKDADLIAAEIERLADEALKSSDPLPSEWLLQDILVGIRYMKPTPRLREVVRDLTTHQTQSIFEDDDRNGQGAIAAGANRTLQHWSEVNQTLSARPGFELDPASITNITDPKIQRNMVNGATFEQLESIRPVAGRLGDGALSVQARRIADPDLYRLLFKRATTLSPDVWSALNAASASAPARGTRGLMPPEDAWDVLTEAAENPVLKDYVLQVKRAVCPREGLQGMSGR